MSSYHTFRHSILYQSTLSPRLVRRSSSILEVELDLYGAVKGKESIILSVEVAKALGEELVKLATEAKENNDDVQFG